MIARIWKWISSCLPVSKIGILFSMLFANAAAAAAKEIFDPENQKKALEFVKALAKDTTLSNREKAQRFNLQMLIWAKEVGKVMSESVINCLRELAVNALKA